MLMLMKTPTSEHEPEAIVESVATVDDMAFYQTFDSEAIEYITDMIRHYHAGTVPWDYGGDDDEYGREKFLTNCECGFVIKTGTAIEETRVRIEHLAEEAFLADPSLAIDIPWEYLARHVYDGDAGRFQVRVIYDWHPDRLEYIRAEVEKYVALDHDIIYIDWPNDVPKPAPGKHIHEHAMEVNQKQDRERGNGFRVKPYLTNRDETFPLLDSKKKHPPKALAGILPDLRATFGGFPYRLGNMLFVPDVHRSTRSVGRGESTTWITPIRCYRGSHARGASSGKAGPDS